MQGRVSSLNLKVRNRLQEDRKSIERQENDTRLVNQRSPAGGAGRQAAHVHPGAGRRPGPRPTGSRDERPMWLRRTSSRWRRPGFVRVPANPRRAASSPPPPVVGSAYSSTPRVCTADIPVMRGTALLVVVVAPRDNAAYAGYARRPAAAPTGGAARSAASDADPAPGTTTPPNRIRSTGHHDGPHHRTGRPGMQANAARPEANRTGPPRPPRSAGHRLSEPEDRRRQHLPARTRQRQPTRLPASRAQRADRTTSTRPRHQAPSIFGGGPQNPDLDLRSRWYTVGKIMNVIPSTTLGGRVDQHRN